MKTKTTELKLNLGFIAQQSVGYTREFQFAIPHMKFDPEFEVRNLEGKIVVSRTSEGLLTRGNFFATTNTTCARCIDDFGHPLVVDFMELFAFADHAKEDTDLIYPEDGQVDFSPILGEYLMLEVPINPICRPDCKGLCPICGNNLNIESCDHGVEKIDPRLEILKSLLDED